MTVAELFAAPSAQKDVAALLQRLAGIQQRHGQELNEMGHYMIVLTRRSLEREAR